MMLPSGGLGQPLKEGTTERTRETVERSTHSNPSTSVWQATRGYRWEWEWTPWGPQGALNCSFTGWGEKASMFSLPQRRARYNQQHPDPGHHISNSLPQPLQRREDHWKDSRGWKDLHPQAGQKRRFLLTSLVR